MDTFNHEQAQAQQGVPADGRWIEVQRHHAQVIATTPQRRGSLDPSEIIGVVLQHARNEPWDGISWIKLPAISSTNGKCGSHSHQVHDNDTNGHWQGDHGTTHKSSTQVAIGSLEKEDLPIATEGSRGKRRAKSRSLDTFGFKQVT